MTQDPFKLKQLIYYITDSGYVRSARVCEIVTNEENRILGYVAKTKHGITIQSNESIFYDNKKSAYLHIKANADRWIDIFKGNLKQWRTMRDRAEDALKRLED